MESGVYIILNPEGKTVSEVVKIASKGDRGAVELTDKGVAAYYRAIHEERELVETLRTGLTRKARGIKAG